jgi:alkanesulfonate monooxygenase SsuD/methylene tetrahydromethanopterin reductase-like flavin-dependent oxidoreductase (luciferase family)
MFIGYFTERPYQDRDAEWYQNFGGMQDLSLSNSVYKPQLGAELFDRYFDEKLFIEEMGFDGVMLNAHHDTPFCMGGGAMNLEAAILARITERLKIVLLGNILPIWDNPLMLAEELAVIDVISRGRLVSGFVRGTGRESLAHNAQPTFNWERFREGHDLIRKAWTDPGPFRWEGNHYQYRYVNPWMRPYQDPCPPIWIPGILSKSTLQFAAEHRYPYIMLDSQLDLTAQTYDYYRQVAAELGFEAGTQHLGYIFKIHVDETEEKAYETGRKLIEGAGNVFLDGSKATPNPWAMRLPGLNPREMGKELPTGQFTAIKRARGIAGLELAAEGESPDQPAPTASEHDERRRKVFDGILGRYACIVGTPETVIPKIRHVLETLRPGSVFLWHGDGDFTHEDSMRGIKLMGEHVLPEMRSMAKELELFSPFEIDPATNLPVESGLNTGRGGRKPLVQA